MSAWVFAWAALWTAAGWLVHLVWWRLSRPRDDLRAVALCMVGLPAALGLLTWAVTGASVLACLLAVVLACSLGTAYVFWYPAAQAVSPTMLVTILAAQAGPGGVTAESLDDAVMEKHLTGDTFDNLLAERFATRGGDGLLRLAPRGRRTLAVIRLLRRAAGFTDPRG